MITNFPKTLKDSTLAFEGVRFDVRSVKLPGKNGPVQRDAVIHPGAVIILPILDENTIVMIQNERFAIGETIWELPAGTLEIGEPPAATAAREVIEETGYEAERIEHLTTFFTSPGICNEIMHAYAAHNLKLVGQNLDDSEKITVTPVTWKEAFHMMATGIIKDCKTITTLLFYHQFKNTAR